MKAMIITNTIFWALYLIRLLEVYIPVSNLSRWMES